ncbi:MAG: hypothetical protein ACRYF3_09930 [Janthinobacterium lividum]
MSSTPEEPTTDSEDQEALRDLARERVQDMPAETALGHADPAGGIDSDPKSYQGDDNG